MKIKYEEVACQSKNYIKGELFLFTHTKDYVGDLCLSYNLLQLSLAGVVQAVAILPFHGRV